MNFTAIILAGGHSRRMGRDKALLPFHGKPLIEHILSIVRKAGASEVMVSTRAGRDYEFLGCPVILDAESECGPLAGIERGLSEAKAPLALVLAVDLPHMQPEFLRWLFGQCDQAAGAVGVLQGRLEPLAAFYPKRAHPLVRRCLAEQRLPAREFARACIQSELVRAAPLFVSQARCFRNWNSPEEFVQM